MEALQDNVERKVESSSVAWRGKYILYKVWSVLSGGYHKINLKNVRVTGGSFHQGTDVAGGSCHQGGDVGASSKEVFDITSCVCDNR